MNKNLKVFCFLCLMLINNCFGQGKTITVTNPISVERKDELVVLKRSFLQQKLGNIPANNYIILKEDNQPKVVQFDDLDGDGKWDEAVFLQSFQPKQAVALTAIVSAKPMAIKAVVRAHVRQMHKNVDQSFGSSVLSDTMPYNNQPTDFSKQKLPPYLTEGPGWENDKVGFRKYFDVRNANDLWGKITDKMVLDFVGVNPDSIYHHLGWWGMDILKVGSSLGAGGLALQMKWKDGKDTLLRLGSNAQIIYKQIADGPIRGIFTLTYKNWQIGSGFKPIEVTEQISIWGGQYFYENEVTVKNSPAGAMLVTGIPDFFNATMVPIKDTAMGVLITLGKQSENADTLGMALIMQGKNVGFEKANDLKSTIKDAYLISEKISTIPICYRFYATWQLSNPLFADIKYYKEYIMSQTKMASRPIIVQ
jgi:hypothetical protein